jgi:hypothetical protein
MATVNLGNEDTNQYLVFTSKDDMNKALYSIAVRNWPATADTPAVPKSKQATIDLFFSGSDTFDNYLTTESCSICNSGAIEEEFEKCQKLAVKYNAKSEQMAGSRS